MKNKSLEQIDRKLYYALIIISNVLLLILAIGIIRKGFSLDFYTDAFYSSNCKYIQLFYSYGEEFSEENSVVTSNLTKFKDGYSINLFGVNIKNIELARMDYGLIEGKKVTAQGLSLRFNRIPIKQINFDNSTWGDCTLYDLEYIGNNTFRTTGIDPIIILPSEIIHGFKTAYIAFCRIFLMIYLLVIIILVVLEIRYQNKIMNFFVKRIGIGYYKISPTAKEIYNTFFYPIVVKIRGVIYHPLVMKIYNMIYPIVIIIVGINWQKKGIDLRRINGAKWNVLIIILLCSFYLWLRMNIQLKRDE